jgi:hypothetical protein
MQLRTCLGILIIMGAMEGGQGGHGGPGSKGLQQRVKKVRNSNLEDVLTRDCRYSIYVLCVY